MFLFSVRNCARSAIFTAAAFFMVPAFAHSDGSHPTTGFAAGFMHPFSGADHLLAMLAIGIWASQNKRPALWLLPLVFPLVTGLGAVLSIAGVRFPGIETGIAASVAVLGLLIAFAVNMPLVVSVALVSLFAFVHGQAHGMEMAQTASAILIGAGFMAATGLLHLAGAFLGLAADRGMAARAIRLAGAGIAATGVYLLAGLA